MEHRKKIDYLAVIAAAICALLSIPLSACGYGDEREKILNVPQENYLSVYNADGCSAEVAVSADSPYFYYFSEDADCYIMKRDRLLSWDFYLENEPDDYFCDTITYQSDSGAVTFNGEAVGNAAFGYSEFKSYCLGCYGDSINENFTAVIYGIVQACLGGNKIHQIIECDNLNICYADFDVDTLCGNAAYIQLLQSVLSESCFDFFLGRYDALSSAQKSVVVEFVANGNYTAVYPHIKIWQNGIDWLNIDFLSYKNL